MRASADAGASFRGTPAEGEQHRRRIEAGGQDDPDEQGQGGPEAAKGAREFTAIESERWT